MRLHKSKKGSKETVVLVMSLVVILALGFVLLVGGVGKIADTFKNLFKKAPAECSHIGIKGFCACTSPDRACPGDTGAITSTDCPPDGYGPDICLNADKTKRALSKAQADNVYGHCCFEQPKQSIFS